MGKICVAALALLVMGLGVQVGWAGHKDASNVLILDNGQKVLKVQVGGSDPSMEELIWRVQQLEQAVEALQHQCYSLPRQRVRNEGGKDKKIWTCTVKAMGETYYGNGPSRGLAEKDAMQECKNKGQSGFFCKVEECTDQ